MLELCLKFKFHTNSGLFLNQCLCQSGGGEGAGSISYILDALTIFFFHYSRSQRKTADCKRKEQNSSWIERSLLLKEKLHVGLERGAGEADWC